MSRQQERRLSSSETRWGHDFPRPPRHSDLWCDSVLITAALPANTLRDQLLIVHSAFRTLYHEEYDKRSAMTFYGMNLRFVKPVFPSCKQMTDWSQAVTTSTSGILPVCLRGFQLTKKWMSINVCLRGPMWWCLIKRKSIPWTGPWKETVYCPGTVIRASIKICFASISLKAHDWQMRWSTTKQI